MLSVSVAINRYFPPGPHSPSDFSHAGDGPGAGTGTVSPPSTAAAGPGSK